MDIDAVKDANPLQDVLEADGFEIGARRGRYWKTREHDSLVVDTREQYYVWNSRGESGDVVDWVQRRHKLDFKSAVEWLCDRAGMERPQWGSESAQERVASRKREDAIATACRYWIGLLRDSDAARAYCQGRGWSDNAIQAAGLGFTGPDSQGLRAELRMHEVDLKSPVARAVLKAPAGMLVYPHVRGGRVRYFSCRSIEGKKHWNPPADLLGERQPYFNWRWHEKEHAVVVEGQADAISLAQLDVAAVALAGTSAGNPLVRELQKRRQVWIGLDNQGASDEVVESLAQRVGPMTRIIAAWPEGKDANDWLAKGRPEPEDVRELLERATPFVFLLAERAGQAAPSEYPDAVKNLALQLGKLGDLGMAIYVEEIAKRMSMNGRRVGVRDLNRILKAARGEMDDAAAQPDYDDELTRAVYTMGGRDRSLNLPEGWLLEPIYDVERGRPAFAVRKPSGEISIMPKVLAHGYECMPHEGVKHFADQGAVIWPDGLGNLRPVDELVRDVRVLINDYVELDETFLNVTAVFVIFTWLYDSFTVTAYLRLLGDKGTGKTRFLEVLWPLVYRGTYMTGAATMSPMFRTMDLVKGVLILDEADYRNSEIGDEIVKMLTVGYRRGGNVARAGSEKDDYMAEFFDVWCPKVLASRQDMADDAIGDRSFDRRAMTAIRELPLVLDDAFQARTRQLRNELLTFRMHHWRSHVDVDFNALADRSLPPRLQEISLPLRVMLQESASDTGMRMLDSYLRNYMDERAESMKATIAGKVLEATVRIIDRPPDAVGPDETPMWDDFTVGRVALMVDRMMDIENEIDREAGITGGKNKKFTPHACGRVLRTKLGLTTRKRSDRTRAYEIVLEQERIDVLRKRYGFGRFDSEAEMAITAELLSPPKATEE